MRHGDRARVARFDLGEEHECRGPSHVGTRLGVSPSRGVSTVRNGGRDDPVIRRMVFDLVDAVSPAIEGLQFGDHRVGQLGVVLEPGTADQFTDIGEFTGGPIGVVTRDAFGQDRIEQELVDVRARYRLVEHCMGAMRSRVGDGLLGNISHDRPFSSLRG